MSDDGKNRELEHESGTQTLVQPSQKTKTPPMYKVVILNDDFTPREFVVHILKKFFNKDEVEAHRLMMQVHHSGSGVAESLPMRSQRPSPIRLIVTPKQISTPLKAL